MHYHIDYVVKLFTQVVDHVSDKCPFRDRSVDISKQICDGFEVLRIGMNGLVTYHFCAQIVIKLNGTSLFIVSEEVLNAGPGFA